MLCVCAGACPGQTPVFVPLGFAAPEQFRSTAYAVSADGTVVVGAAESVSGVEAWRWTATTGMVSLGDLPGGALHSHAAAVSGDGSVVVGTATSASGTRPFRWTPAGGLVDLGALPGGDGRGRASGVSADGAIVVGASTIAGGSAAFRWTAGTGMVSLGALAGGQSISEAEAISGDGGTIVGYAWTGSQPVPMRWTAATGMEALAESGGAVHRGAAHALSADGAMIVGYRGVPGLEQQAFRWTAAGGVSGPGAGGADSFPAVATAVGNAPHFVLAGRTARTGVIYAVLWDEYYGLSNLADLLRGSFGLEQALRGWTLTCVLGISGDGATLVGEGINPSGQVEAWMARFDMFCRPPMATVFPADEAIPGGATRQYQVEVGSPIPATHQWFRNGVPLSDTDTVSGTASTTLTFLSFAPEEAGEYTLRSSNACGTSSTPSIYFLYRPPCPLDYNDDGVVNPDDLGDYITDYFFYAESPLQSYPARVDFNGDGSLNPDDIGDYITSYFLGAC